MNSNAQNSASEDPIETAIRELKAAQKSEGNAGANMHLLFARSAIDRSINQMGNQLDTSQL